MPPLWTGGRYCGSSLELKMLKQKSVSFVNILHHSGKYYYPLTFFSLYHWCWCLAWRVPIHFDALSVQRNPLQSRWILQLTFNKSFSCGGPLGILESILVAHLGQNYQAFRVSYCCCYHVMPLFERCILIAFARCRTLWILLLGPNE